MIITTKQNIRRFTGIHKNLDKAISFIQHENLKSLPLGKTEIDGNEVFVNHFQYDTVAKEEGFLEAHEHYVDIHVVLSGKEYLGYCDIDAAHLVQPFEEENDFYKYEADIHNFAYLDKTYLAITFQEDAHQPKIMVNTPEAIDKLVFKVKIK